jgi:hypothetical protein
MLFASLVIERNTLEVADLPAAFVSWVQAFGALATVGLIIWAFIGMYRALGFRESAAQLALLTLLSGFILVLGMSATFGPVVRAIALIALFVIALIWVVVALILILLRVTTVEDLRSARGVIALVGLGGAILSYTAFFMLLGLHGPAHQGPPIIYTWGQEFALTLSGAFAVLGVSFPVVQTLVTRVRFRRIWALARLSIKEAWSKGIIWVALIIPVLYLYSDWYLNPSEFKNQLAQRVRMVYFAMTVLFVVSALLLGSFNIPTDVKNQTIHTIVTKPVERYEIVLGRFIGYALLLLVELTALSGLSLFYTVRGLNEEAKQESFHARVPLFARGGEEYKAQEFYPNPRGESVGREWEYRKYFGGVAPQGGGTKQYAIWHFPRIPGSLADRTDSVRLEYSFDIFRTTKGDEKVQGVKCTFTFAPGHLSVPQVEAAVREWVKERDQQRIDPKVLADKYGVYVAREVKVADYHTLPLDVPAALFGKLYRDQDKPENRSPDGSQMPALKVLVNLEAQSGPQMLGVARYDLYILAGDQPFWINFLKGSLGLWFITCLVLGIALTFSCYLSGVISLLATAVLCGTGLILDFIRSLALGTSPGGGPFEAAYRLANRRNLAMQLDRSNTAVNILQSLDETYRWLLRLVMSLIPDVKRFDLTAYVASGFDISWSQILFADSLVPLLGYLIPCGILAYYLINSREIANPT